MVQVKRAWRSVLEDGDGVPAGMKLVLRPAELSLDRDQGIRIGVPANSPVLERLESPAARRALEDAMARRLGRPVSLVFATSDSRDAPAEQRITAESVKRDRLRRLTEEEPLLAAAVEEWDLELIE